MTKLKKIILSVLGMIFVLGGVVFLKGVNTFSSMSSSDSIVALKNDKRWDILLLGHQPAGGLTDSIIVLSYKKETGEIALISLPRDLFVSMSGYGKQRINYAYVAGEKKDSDGGGLRLAKEVVSNVTGLDIDFVVAGDIYALEEIVDTMGGIEIDEDRYFSTDFYGHYVKIYPGKNYLSGSETLAYVGSRAVAGSDFGRMERQQKALVALKDKTLSFGMLARPDKVWSIFNSLEKHIETDIPFSQVKDLIQMASGLEIQNIDQIVFDTSNYLYSTHSAAGAYILLPKSGDFLEIQQKCNGVFDTVGAEEAEDAINL